MGRLSTSNYQTYILFFSWTIGLIAIMIRLFVKIELTPIILLFAVLDIVFNLKRKNDNFNKFSYHIIFLILMFYAWLFVSTAYSPSYSYKFTKAINFIANVIFFIYPFFIKKINFHLLIRLYCIIILPLAAYFDYMLSIVWKVRSAGTELFMNIRDAYLVVGLQLGILFILLLYFNKHIILKVITFGLLLATSARGPLIFLILVSLIYLVSENKIQILNPKYILRSVAVLVGLSVIFYFKAENIGAIFENTIKRFASLLGGEDGSSLERVYRLSFAFNQPFEKLSTFFFGNGFGSFGILYEKIDKRSYPHNILLECFFELGIIGLVLFLLLFITIYRKISMRKNVFGLLFIFAFLNAMKSANITDLWVLFSFMGGIVAMNAGQMHQNRMHVQ